MNCIKTSFGEFNKVHIKLPRELDSVHWRSSRHAVTHVRNKNSNIQGRLPNVVKVIFHTERNCS